MRTVAQGNDVFPDGRILPQGGTANLPDRRVRDAVGRSRLLATATCRTLTTADASPGIERHGDRLAE
jgi:hypothetical protein